MILDFFLIRGAAVLLKLIIPLQVPLQQLYHFFLLRPCTKYHVQSI